MLSESRYGNRFSFLFGIITYPCGIRKVNLQKRMSFSKGVRINVFQVLFDPAWSKIQCNKYKSASHRASDSGRHP